MARVPLVQVRPKGGLLIDSRGLEAGVAASWIDAPEGLHENAASRTPATQPGDGSAAPPARA